MIKLGNLRLSSTPKETQDASTAARQATAAVESNNGSAGESDSRPNETQREAEPAPAPANKPTGIRLAGMRMPAADSSVPARVDAGVGGVAIVETAPIPAEGTPEGFQAKLDKLDSLLAKSGGVLNDFIIGTCRSYVQEIFIELGKYPELDPIFVDRDMHNIMSFMQATATQAKVTLSEKKVKSESRAAKKVTTDFGDFGSFGDLSNKPVTNQMLAHDAAGDALAAFGALDVSGIEAKTRR